MNNLVKKNSVVMIRENKQQETQLTSGIIDFFIYFEQLKT